MKSTFNQGIRVGIAAALLISLFSPTHANWRDPGSSSLPQNNYSLNNPALFNPRFTPHFDWYRPNNYITSPLIPDLIINRDTLNNTFIPVRDFDNHMFTYQQESANFNSKLNLFDQYSADMQFFTNNQAAPHRVHMDLNGMKFENGKLLPAQYSKAYKDTEGNRLEIDRFNQTTETNGSFKTFVDYVQRTESRQSNKSTVGSFPPSKELIKSFEEKWAYYPANKTGNDKPDQYNLTLEGIEWESNFQRFVSGYKGSVEGPDGLIHFDVRSPHDSSGNIQSIDIYLSGSKSPTAHIRWDPTIHSENPQGESPPGQKSSEALASLRNNLPIPLLVGPRSQYRLNESDIVENPVRVTAEGLLSNKALGSITDLPNFKNKEDIGLNIQFIPPTHNGDPHSPQVNQTSHEKNGLGNALRNLWYMMTGRWSDVKGIRRDLNRLIESDPEQFVLAAGFEDPSFMSYSRLKNLDKQLIPSRKFDPSRNTEKKFTFFKVMLKPFSPLFEVAKTTLRTIGIGLKTITQLPVIKETLITVRILTDIIIAPLSGDLFDKPNPVKFSKNGPAVVAFPGIKTNQIAERDIYKLVKKIFNFEEMTIIKNGTHYFGFGDAIQILAHEFLGTIDRPARDMANAIRIGIQEKGMVLVVLHSQGTGGFKQTLSLLTPEEKSKIHVISIGAQWFIDSGLEGLGSAINIWNDGDYIPTLGNRLRIISNYLLPWNWGRMAKRDLDNTYDANTSWGVKSHLFSAYEEAITKWKNDNQHRWLNTAPQPVY